MCGKRGRRWLGPFLVLLTISLGLATTATPARADVTGVSPSSREVNPGETTTARVTIDYPATTCVQGSGSVEATFSPACGDNEWQSTMTVRAPDQPGTYVVDITHQATNTSRRFELRVRAPAPPPPPPPPPPETTTTVRPTTTLPPTTTTTPATTAPPETTTTVAETTTTVAPPPPGGGFVPIATLVAGGVPAEGVFLPFATGGYRTCLPLAEPCVDPASAVILVPARTTELAWPPLAEGAASPPRLDLRGLPPLLPVGVAPPDPGAQDYALPVLDLAAQGGQLRTLVRGLDETGRFVTARVGSGVAVPQAEGPMAAPEAETFLASEPFGRPRLADKDDFTEAAPAVPLFSSTSLQVLYGLHPDPSWGLNVDFLPFFGETSVPYLVRAVDGPPGLYVARPAGLRIPQAGSGDAPADEPEDGGDGGVPAVALLGGAVGIGAIATAALAFRRRRAAA